jgi:hypothetical protein
MESYINTIVSVIGTVFLIWKTFTEFNGHKRTNLREDYKTSDEVIKDLMRNDSLHPIVIEKGLRTIAGTNQLSAVEIIYLISLERPSRKVDLYMKSEELLVFDENKEVAISFKKEYQHLLYRRLREFFSIILYGICFLFLFGAIFFHKTYLEVVSPEIFIVALVFSIFIGWGSIKKFASIKFAEELVENQKPTEKGLILKNKLMKEFQSTP